MKFIFALVSLVLLSTGSLYSQIQEHEHEHALNEIGLGYSPVYLFNEKALHMGFHAHYIRKIEHSKFGVGISYERIFDEHKHNTYGVLASYNPVGNLNLSVSPGLTFEDHSKKPDLSLHIETLYEFDLNFIHIGPVLEAAFSKEDIHLSLGLHIGFGF